MKPVKFKEQNRCLAKPKSMTEEECQDLYVYTDEKVCVSCWKLSFIERLKALIFGKVWLGVLSGGTQPPVWLDCTSTVFAKK